MINAPASNNEIYYLMPIGQNQPTDSALPFISEDQDNNFPTESAHVTQYIMAGLSVASYIYFGLHNLPVTLGLCLLGYTMAKVEVYVSTSTATNDNQDNQIPDDNPINESFFTYEKLARTVTSIMTVPFKIAGAFFSFSSFVINAVIDFLKSCAEKIKSLVFGPIPEREENHTVINESSLLI